MPVLFRFMTPKVGRIGTPGMDDVLDEIYDTTAKGVSVDLWPIAPATMVLDGANAPTVSVNGTLIASNFAASSLIFTLGGLTAETPGALNTLVITAFDDV